MRSEAWRPAAAARNRWPREAREVARQALRPVCEELAARIRRQCRRRKRGPEAQNRHGGAPRGVPPSTRTFLGAPRTSRVKLLTLLRVPIWLRCKTYTSTYLSFSLYIFSS